MTQWSDDRIESLKSLWEAGLSASQVANALGNVSRNAVIGKIHRLGLAGRVSPRRASGLRRPAARLCTSSPCKPVIAVVEEEPFKFEDGSFATMSTISNQMCRWPMGDPADSMFHLCGRSPKSGSPYCKAHEFRAHQPRRKSRTVRKSQLAKRQALS